MRVRCPNCHDSTEVDDGSELSAITCLSCGSQFSLVGEQTLTYSHGDAKTIGHFELQDEIGIGAFGSVWVAKDTQLDRTVAVKIPRKGQLDPQEAAQFLREARAAAQLKHPNIVAVHEVGREDGQVYIVSDYVEGLTLADWLVGQQLTSRAAAELCLKIAEALHHAHEQGVIHRDLKPTNIILDRNNEPHIMDFGLARREAGEVTMTMEGKVLGTPAYMSPEQAKGEAHTADRRADVYSLGVILYELLTGHKPFRGNVRMLIRQVIEDDAPSPRRLNSSIPRDLETVCLKCLEKEPQKRYGDARELAEEFRRFLNGEAVLARAITAPDRAWRWCRRNRAVAALAVAIVVISIAFGSIGVIVAIEQARLATEKSRLAQDNANLVESERENSQELERQLRVSDVRRLAAQSESARVEYPVRSLLLALEAVDRSQQEGGTLLPIAHEALLNASFGVGGQPLSAGFAVYSLAISENSRWLVAAGADLRVWDLAGGEGERSPLDLQGHKGNLRSVEISPDSRWIAALTSGEKVVRVWDMKSSDQTRPALTLDAHDAVITSLAFSPRGNWLATGSLDCTVRVWRLSTSDPADSSILLDGHDDGVTDLAFLPDGNRLVTASADGIARLWDLDRENPSPVEFRGHTAGISSLAIDKAGRRLATGSRDQTVRVWDLFDVPRDQSGLMLRGATRVGHGQGIDMVEFSRSGRWLTASAYGMPAQVWDLESAELSATALRAPSGLGVSSLAITADSRWVVGGVGIVACAWDITADDPFAKPTLLRGHDGRVRAIVASPDGKWLVTGSWDSQVRLWNMTQAGPSPSEQILGGHREFVHIVKISPDGRWAITSSGDTTVRVWDLFGPRGVALSRVLQGHEALISSIAFSSDCQRLATGSWDGSARVWDLNADGSEDSGVVLKEHTGRVHAVGITSDDRWLVTAGQDGAARLWDLTDSHSTSSKYVLPAGDAEVKSLASSFNGNWLVTGSSDGKVTLWDLRSKNPRSSPVVLQGSGEEVAHLLFTPDSNRVIGGSRYGRVRIWDLTAKDPSTSSLDLDDRGKSRNPITDLTVTADSRWLVTAAAEGTPRLWDLHLADPTSPAWRLRGHGAFVTSADVDSEGRTLVTGSGDSTARVWRLDTDEPADSSLTLRGHGGAVVAAISPNGRWVLTGSRDTTARLWDLNSDSLVERARRLAGRDFSLGERLQYALD